MKEALRQAIKGNVTFLHYRKNNLWYQTTSGYVFPVPIDDTGDGTFLPKDRAILFMRYIRKQMEEDLK